MQSTQTPCYLPDGRIVFTSTRPGSLVPCFNSGVDTLHVMDADGGNVRPLSSNNVTEFDPAVMHDGRMEEALFANNLAKPTAVLDARPVPNSHLVVAAFTPHNGQSVGAIVMIDPRKGKNDLGAVANFTPEYPVEMDQGLRLGPSDPWPLSEDVVLVANNATGRGVIQIIGRYGVYRCKAGTSGLTKLNAEPLRGPSYTDADVEAGVKYAYVVRALDRRGRQSVASERVEATPLKSPQSTAIPTAPHGPARW